MSRFATLVLIVALLGLAGGSAGQDAKKEDPKPADPNPSKAGDPPTGDEPVRGILPQKWGRLELSEAKKQEIYKVQAKYRTKIEALEKQIEELKRTRDREMVEVLSPEEKQKLIDILLGIDD